MKSGREKNGKRKTTINLKESVKPKQAEIKHNQRKQGIRWKK